MDLCECACKCNNVHIICCICLDVGEAVSSDDGLGGDTADGDHRKAAVEELGNLLLLETSIVLGGKLGAEGEICS